MNINWRGFKKVVLQPGGWARGLSTHHKREHVMTHYTEPVTWTDPLERPTTEKHLARPSAFESISSDDTVTEKMKRSQTLA
jgi:transcription initiation factor IIF auxiliary subunit